MMKSLISRENLPAFEEMWETYFKPLEGKTIHLSSDSDHNEIKSVTDEGILRISRNGIPSFVPIEAFAFAYNVMLSRPTGEVYRKTEIHENFKSCRCSSFVVAVIGGYVPFVDKIGRAEGLRLRLK